MRMNPRKWGARIAALALCAVCAGQASALEYTVDAPEDYLFGRPSSVETVYRETAPVNTDRSKNVSLIPPGFGTPTSYLPGSGEYLTPNLVPGALSGGLVSAVGPGTAAAGYTTAAVSTNGAVYPAATATGTGSTSVTNTASETAAASVTTEAAVQYPDTFTVTYEPTTGTASSYGAAFTDVTSGLYYSGGYLGTLKIPSIGVNVKVYQGTDTDALAKGAGHFSDTSIWDGNVAIAGHNRGTNCYFADIHTLDIGDRVTFSTKLGTRTYSVTSVKKVSVTDDSDTGATAENCVTLYTCVRNQSEYRWCVRAVEVS